MEGDKNEEVSQCEEKLKQVNEMNTRSTDAVSFKMKKTKVSLEEEKKKRTPIKTKMCGGITHGSRHRAPQPESAKHASGSGYSTLRHPTQRPIPHREQATRAHVPGHPSTLHARRAKPRR